VQYTPFGVDMFFDIYGVVQPLFPVFPLF